MTGIKKQKNRATRKTSVYWTVSKRKKVTPDLNASTSMDIKIKLLVITYKFDQRRWYYYILIVQFSQISYHNTIRQTFLLFWYLLPQVLILSGKAVKLNWHVHPKMAGSFRGTFKLRILKAFGQEIMALFS